MLIARDRLNARHVVLVAVVLILVGLWLAFDNPDVSGSPVWDSYTCLAPWDTVLNNEDNYPGGMHPEDLTALAQRCRTAGERRFTAAVSMAALGLVLLGSAPLVVRRRRVTSAQL